MPRGLLKDDYPIGLLATIVTLECIFLFIFVMISHGRREMSKN